ncbi:MAG: IPT/TIG domain-containing protein [Bacteroidota bacterium]
MKTTLQLFGLCFMLFAFISCSDDDDGDTLVEFTVTSITPESGTVGTEVTIAGTDFPTDTSEVTVTFGGVTATITSLTSTQIVTTVPDGATSGAVGVSANGFDKTAPSSFTVEAEIVEFTITSIAPEKGTVGTEVTITGTDFPTDASEITVSFGEVAATITSVNSTQIVTTVPAGATSGEVSVVANGFDKTATSSFTVLLDLVSGTMENLFAPTTSGFGEPAAGPFTKFSFATGTVTESDTEWDIAFRATTIAVNGGDVTGTDDEPVRNGNGGAAIEDALFDEVVSADGLTYAQDGTGAFAIPTGSDNGWYNYNFMTNVVSPLPGKIVVFRTHDGKYAKIEILSYYEDAPANPDGFVDAPRYYTFNYIYNPNDGETTLAD